MQYVQKSAKTGLLSFRRIYPAHLRPHILGHPTELKRSLKSKDVKEPGALAIYEQALAEYEATVERADRLANQRYDTLDLPIIAKLTTQFELDWLAHDEEVRWTKGRDGVERSEAGWEWHLSDFRRWQAYGELDEITDFWEVDAHKLIDQEGLLLPPDDTGIDRLCRELNAAAIRVHDVVAARLRGEAPAPAPALAEFPVALSEPSGTPQGSRQPLPLLETFDAYAKATSIAHSSVSRRPRAWQSSFARLTLLLGSRVLDCETRSAPSSGRSSENQARWHRCPMVPAVTLTSCSRAGRYSRLAVPASSSL